MKRPPQQILQHFHWGDTVEVLRRDQNQDVWFPATVLRPSSAHQPDNHIYVEFETIRVLQDYDDDDDDVDRDNRNRAPLLLREVVDIADVRPAPLQELHRFFKIGDLVEAFCFSKGKDKRGWRKAKVLNILENSKYEVKLLYLVHNNDHHGGDNDDDVDIVEQWGLRVCRVWEDGSWVPPLQLRIPSDGSDNNSPARSIKLRMKLKCHQKSSSSWGKFCKGMLVEVKSDEEGFQGSWYEATIVGLLGNDKVLLEYRTLKTEDESQFLKVKADASYIRPCPPQIHRLEPFQLLAQVDAWYNDGWWEGYVSRVIDGFTYLVYFTSTNEEMVFKHVQLRPHQDCINDEWILAPKIVDAPTSSAAKVEKKTNLKIRINCSGITAEKLFSKGMMVEVKSDEEGYQGSWYAAAIVCPVSDDRFLVEYQTLRTDDESQLLKEIVKSAYIRPCPPRIEKLDGYKMLEEVDAWFNDGWWVGLVSKVLGDSKYAVYFWTTNEEMEFVHYDLRPHQEWIAGRWHTDFKKKTKMLKKSKLGKLRGRSAGVALAPCFCNGTKVEVKSDEEGHKGYWYPATIIRPTGNGKYLVEYQTLKTDDESEPLKEEADALCIRPCPGILQQTERFKSLEDVDAWYDDGWWEGQVCKVIEGSKYTVYFESTNKVMEFQHSDLRPHQDWINQQWIWPIRGRDR